MQRSARHSVLASGDTASITMSKKAEPINVRKYACDETPDSEGLMDLSYVFKSESMVQEVEVLLGRLDRACVIGPWEAKDHTFGWHNIKTGESTSGTAEQMREFAGVHHLERGVYLRARTTHEEFLKCLGEVISIRREIPDEALRRSFYTPLIRTPLPTVRGATTT